MHRIAALLLICLAGWAGEVPADAVSLVGCDTPFTAASGSWAGKATVASGRLLLSGCSGAGAVDYPMTTGLAEHADDSVAILVQSGPANTAQSIGVCLKDQDGRACGWSFALPKPGAEPVLVAARDGASLAVPNRPDPRDCGVNDLRRITTCRLQAEAEDKGVLDIRIAAVLAVKPDVASLAARAALAEKQKKAQGWTAARLALSAKYLANFPELSVAVPPAIPGKRTIRAFHIGNSLTFKALSHQYKEWSLLGYEERLLALMDGRGVHYVPGWHISWGASLPSIWSHPFEPAVANAGALGKALVDCTWDVLTVQLWGADSVGDVAAAKGMIAMALAKNPELQSYLVETWVHKEKTLVPDFPTQWNRPWQEGDRYGIPPIHCQAYARLVFRRLREATADLRRPVRLIPIGSVMAELDRRMRAGQVAGFTRVEDLYNDDVHLTENGNYVALETFFAVILGKDPKGQPRSAFFPTVDDAFAAAVQDAVWQVVATTPETGVSAPGAAPAAPPPAR